MVLVGLAVPMLLVLLLAIDTLSARQKAKISHVQPITSFTVHVAQGGLGGQAQSHSSGCAIMFVLIVLMVMMFAIDLV